MKRHLTLIEVLISASLLLILLTTLFSTYAYFVRGQRVLEEREQQAFKELYLQARLSEIFSKLSPDVGSGGESKKNQKSYFYLAPSSHSQEKSDVLVFTYFNETGNGPDFSNQVIGKLFLDPAGRLILLTWPWIERDETPGENFRMEVLATQVKDLRFKFFKAPKRETQDHKIDPESKTQGYGEWNETWSAEEGIPVAVQVILPNQTLYFAVPNPEAPVFYP